MFYNVNTHTKTWGWIHLYISLLSKNNCEYLLLWIRLMFLKHNSYEKQNQIWSDVKWDATSPKIISQLLFQTHNYNPGSETKLSIQFWNASFARLNGTISPPYSIVFWFHFYFFYVQRKVFVSGTLLIQTCGGVDLSFRLQKWRPLPDKVHAQQATDTESHPPNCLHTSTHFPNVSCMNATLWQTVI